MTTETTLGDLPSYELRVIEPKKTKIFRHAGVPRMTIEGDRSWAKVTVARAFPLSDPDHFIGLLDGAGKDIGLLKDPAHLDTDSRRIVDEELEKRYFVPVVDRVSAIKEEHGTVYWTLETDRGRKEVITRSLRDNLQELSASHIIIADVDGNRYEFLDISKLDLKTQAIIMRHM